jgi:16S rRNA (adenine1518-N6/adenine1519-N6)-dimethyltransferase
MPVPGSPVPTKTDLALSNLPPLREVIAAHELSARKGLGQHFLLDFNLTERIARAAGDIEGATVFEVGPGPGGLTRAILTAGAGRLIAVEKDTRCLEALAPLVTAAAGRLTLITSDALETDERHLFENTGVAPRDIHIIANLPYNVATVLLIKWLKQTTETPELYASIVLLMQKEVAQRITAQPRTKAYGRLSVMAQWLCDCEACFDIGPRAFTPPPKVSSTVIKLSPRAAPRAAANWRDMEAVTRAAFGQRRKMLRASLKSLAGSKAEELLRTAGITPTARAEELSVEEFGSLARAWAAER